MRRKGREICILLCLERAWERGTVFTVKDWARSCYVTGQKKYPDLTSKRFRIHSVFKYFHSGEWIQKVADSHAGFTGHVWTEAVSGKKKLRIQKYPDMCGRGLVVHYLFVQGVN